MQVIKVGEKVIGTDANGYGQLIQFYNQAKQFSEQRISLDFYGIDWFDGNMAALLGAIIYKLNKDNRLIFSTDGAYIKQKFDVLIKNGTVLYGDTTDDRKTTLPFSGFTKVDKDGFISYIERNLMQHQGMPKLTAFQQEQIQDDLLELMSNVNYHSNTDDPFFVCGQYYPNNDFLVFTMVDLGIGFLPKIRDVTNGEVANAEKAVLWALSGQTTKPVHERVPGGLGIRNIHKYCRENAGKLHIATGDAFWQSELALPDSIGCRRLIEPFTGSMINLFFKHS